MSERRLFARDELMKYLMDRWIGVFGYAPLHSAPH